MTLLDLFHLIRRNVWLILACTLAGVLVAAGYSALQPKVFSATASGYVIANSGGSVAGAFSGDTLAASRAERYLPLASTSAVRDSLAEELEGTGFAPTGISASIVEGSNVMQVSASASDPAQAQAVANAGVKALAAEILRMETLDPSKIKKGTEISSVDDIPSSGKAAIALVPFQEASAPTTPTSPNWKFNLLLGLGIGLVLGVAAAFARRALDVRVRTTAELESLTDHGVLGVIPVAKALSKRSTSKKSAKTELAQEALRQLRANLRFVNVDNPPRSIVVTSANPGEGKSTVASNLARVLAAGGQPTVLIDADLRRPAIHKEFDLDSSVGLSQVLSGDVALRDAMQETDTQLLHVLPAGRIPPNPSELVGSKQMAKLIAALAVNRTVIIDAPPVLPVSDAGLLSVASDGALLVVRTGKTMREHVNAATKRIEQMGGALLGSVLNLASPRRMGETLYGVGYSSKSYNTYYSSSEPAEGDGALLAPHVPERAARR